MATFLRKALGAILMLGAPSLVSSWIIGTVADIGVLQGFLLFMLGVLSVIGVCIALLLIATLMEIGRKLWAGEKITWQKL